MVLTISRVRGHGKPDRSVKGNTTGVGRVPALFCHKPNISELVEL